MKIKEKMMESMMAKMSKQEKQEMMEKMMEQFFSGMTEQEKKEMMKEMMPKMMQQMMGGMSMMDMMGSMMGQAGDDEETGSKPWDMCRQMMDSMNKKGELGILATPEIQGMFEEWVQQINDEILTFLNDNPSATINQIAENLKITKQSAVYFVFKLAQKDQITLEVSKHDTKKQ